jgi:hypothetical protein
VNHKETTKSLSRDYEEKLRFEVVLTKATTATCVRTQAVSALSKLFESDTMILLLPYFTHSRENFKTINTTDDILPIKRRAALRAYVSDPTLKTVPNQHTKVRLQFFVRLMSNTPIEVTVKKTNGNSNWYKAQDIYITLMELDTTGRTTNESVFSLERRQESPRLRISIPLSMLYTLIGTTMFKRPFLRFGW